jgi:hypothetical protein
VDIGTRRRQKPCTDSLAQSEGRGHTKDGNEEDRPADLQHLANR